MISWTEIYIGIAGLVLSIPVAVCIAARFKLFLAEAEIQQELANMYTPDILTGSITNLENLSPDLDVVNEDASTNNTSAS